MPIGNGRRKYVLLIITQNAVTKMALIIILILLMSLKISGMKYPMLFQKHKIL